MKLRLLLDQMLNTANVLADTHALRIEIIIAKNHQWCPRMRACFLRFLLVSDAS